MTKPETKPNPGMQTCQGVSFASSKFEVASRFGFRTSSFVCHLSFVIRHCFVAFAGICLVQVASGSTLVFEQTSAYHHIRVVDDAGARTLFFDDAPESRMALAN